MPKSRAPHLRNHFVYVIHANECPIYFGHGKFGRLSDRARFIDSLVRLHSTDPHYYKWELHGLVVAEVWAAGVQVCFDQLSQDQTKDEAIAQENYQVKDLVEQGFLLANVHHNSNVRSVAEIASAILTCRKPWSFLKTFQPLNRYTREMLALRRVSRGRQ